MSIAEFTDPAFAAFVLDNEDADVAELLLGRTPPGIDARAAADQILARRKARAKVPAWLETPGVIFPSVHLVEQASSTLTARYKASLLSGQRLVDLTGGLGVDTLALAERFEVTTYVDRDPHAGACFAHNAALLSRRDIDVVTAEAGDYLNAQGGHAVYFVDPARRDAGRKGRYRFEDCDPNILDLLPRLRPDDELLVKASPMLDISEGIRALDGATDVHVLSVGNECRELLFRRGAALTGDPVIHVVELTSESDTYRFRRSEEQACPLTLAEIGRYLYDPAPGLRKAGAFKSIGRRFGLAKLAPNTHLYTADELVQGFPGRSFEVLADTTRPNRELTDRRANVISRNHPLSADGLKKRYRLRDGGERYLIGYRDRQQRARLAVARRVA